MPWVPVKHALRKLREARGWSVQDLVDKTGLSERSITTLESRRPPAFVRANTADLISSAFDLTLRDYNDWKSADRWVTWTPHKGSRESDADELQLGQVGTLPRHAKMERDLGLHDKTIQTSAGPADLLGADRYHKISTLPKLYAGQVFAVTGKVDQHASLPSSAARKIGAVVDEGAMFRVCRAVAKRLPFYKSVCTLNAETTRRLMHAYDSGERIVALVRVVYEPPAHPWRGFFHIESGPPKTKKFVFVIDRIVTETQ